MLWQGQQGQEPGPSPARPPAQAAGPPTPAPTGTHAPLQIPRARPWVWICTQDASAGFFPAVSARVGFPVLASRIAPGRVRMEPAPGQARCTVHIKTEIPTPTKESKHPGAGAAAGALFLNGARFGQAGVGRGRRRAPWQQRQPWPAAGTCGVRSPPPAQQLGAPPSSPAPRCARRASEDGKRPPARISRGWGRRDSPPPRFLVCVSPPGHVAAGIAPRTLPGRPLSCPLPPGRGASARPRRGAQALGSWARMAPRRRQDLTQLRQAPTRRSLKVEGGRTGRSRGAGAADARSREPGPPGPERPAVPGLEIRGIPATGTGGARLHPARAGAVPPADPPSAWRRWFCWAVRPRSRRCCPWLSTFLLKSQVGCSGESRLQVGRARGAGGRPR
nr:basic proline-rich protein [Oryctolagus cuniculus]